MYHSTLGSRVITKRTNEGAPYLFFWSIERYPLSGEAFAIKFDGKGIAGQKLPGAWAQVLLRHSLGEGAYRGNSLIRNDLP